MKNRFSYLVMVGFLASSISFSLLLGYKVLKQEQINYSSMAITSIGGGVGAAVALFFVGKLKSKE